MKRLVKKSEYNDSDMFISPTYYYNAESKVDNTPACTYFSFFPNNFLSEQTMDNGEWMLKDTVNINDNEVVNNFEKNIKRLKYLHINKRCK